MRNIVRSLIAAGLLAATGLFLSNGSASEPATFSVLTTYASPAGDAEIAAATPDGRYVAVTAATTKAVSLLDIADPAAPTETCRMSVAPGEPTSVAIHPSGDWGLIAVKNAGAATGYVQAFEIPSCELTWTAAVGIGPDAVVMTPSGKYALVAIEDEETELGLPGICPNVRPGRVDIVDTDDHAVTAVPIDLTGLVGANCPDDPQPEYIAVDKDNRTAYVTLQENNVVVRIDIKRGEVEARTVLGTTTHLADTTNDGIAQVDDPFTGRRESDGIARNHNGKYLFTADEGDTSRVPGPPEVFSGGRTMTVLNARTLAVVADTGSKIEDAAAAAGTLPTGRTRNRGPEPEGIVVFKLEGREYAAVTLERSNALIVFDVSNPLDPQTVTFLLTGGGAPEGVTFIKSRNLIIVANETLPGAITIICADTGDGCEPLD